MKANPVRFGNVSLSFSTGKIAFGLLVGFVAVVICWALSPHLLAQSSQVTPPLPTGVAYDAYGNPVRSPNGNRINYLWQPEGFLSVEMDPAGTVLVTQTLAMTLFDSPNRDAGSSSILTPSAQGNGPGIQSEYLAEKWKTGIWGTGIGASKISILDLDYDGQQEVVAGGGSGFGSNRFWYIVSQSSITDTYQQEWLSKEYTSNVNRVAVADGTGDGNYEIYVALANGNVEIYDGETRHLLHTLSTSLDIAALVVADADGDGVQEIVFCSSSQIAVFDAETYQSEWQTSAYGGGDIAVADVDADAAPEIVTTRYVIDGVSHALEWDYSAGFGYIIQTADIDGDNMAEIVGAETWYWVRAFDVDTQSTKWELSADLDVDALRVGDVDNDGTQEVLYGDGQWGEVYCYDSVTLVEEWSINNPDHGVTDINFGDVDADGTVEVLWGGGWTSTGADHLFVGDTTTQSIEWQSYHIDGPLSALDVGDVDADGTQEIVMVSFESNSGYDDGIIFVYDAETYNLEWESSPLPGVSAWTGVHALKVANLDGDAALEIIVGADDLYDGVILVYDGITHNLDWQTSEFNGAPFYALAVADVDNDGQVEVVGGQGREHTGALGVYVRVFDGSTGAHEWHTLDLGYWVNVYNIDVADSDGDGHPEIIFGVEGNEAYVYDGVTQAEDWQSSLSDVKAVKVVDVDGDGTQEILVGRTDGQLYAFDGQTYAQEWSDPISSQAINGLEFTDMDRDTLPELILADSSYLGVYDPVTRDPIWQSEQLGSLVANGGHLVVQDIDYDTRNEVVLGCSYALYLFAYDLLPYSSTKEVSTLLAKPGDRLDYALTIVNLSDNPLSMTANDPIPEHTGFITGSLAVSAGSWEIVDDTITWQVQPEASAHVSLTFAVTVELTALDGTEIVNTALYSGGGFLTDRSAVTVIDALPPASLISHPQAREIVSGSLYAIQGTATDSLSGVDYVEVNINGEDWLSTTGTTGWVYSWTLPMTDDLYTVQSRAVDLAGHIEEPITATTFWVDNLSPQISETSPAHGSSDIPKDDPIVVMFSEPILSDTLAFACQPDPGDWSVQESTDRKRITLTHALFEPGQIYSFHISHVKDRAGHGLIPSPVPNPWAFSTERQLFYTYLPLCTRSQH